LAVQECDYVFRLAKDVEDDYEWHRDDDGNWTPKLRVSPVKGRQPGLQFNPDFSVQWREHLGMHSKGASDLVAATNRPLVFEANVGEIRKLRAEGIRRFYVAYTPTDEEPLGCAHVSVLLLLDKELKAASLSLRTDLSNLLALVHGTPSIPVPEGA
jgi:hypothetical protein